MANKLKIEIYGVLNNISFVKTRCCAEVFFFNLNKGQMLATFERSAYFFVTQTFKEIFSKVSAILCDDKHVLSDISYHESSVSFRRTADSLNDYIQDNILSLCDFGTSPCVNELYLYGGVSGTCCW